MRKSAALPIEQSANQRRRPDPPPPRIDLGLVVIGLIWVCALAGVGLLVWTLVGH